MRQGSCHRVGVPTTAVIAWKTTAFSMSFMGKDAQKLPRDVMVKPETGRTYLCSAQVRGKEKALFDKADRNAQDRALKTRVAQLRK